MTTTETLPILKKRMLEYLTALASKVTIEGAYGDNGESKGAEVVIRDLMNVLYGYDLKLEKKVNAAGFDLCDTFHHVMVQVTSNCTAEKVEECLRTTCERVVSEPHLKDYTLYIVFLSVDNHCMETLRKNAANKLGAPEPNDKRKLTPYPFQMSGIRFVPHSGIINLDTFLQMLRDCEDAAGQRLNSNQLHGLEEILNNFYNPVYLAEEICKQFPEKRLVYFSASGQVQSLCLQDIYNMLTDNSDSWIEHIVARLDRSDIQLHTASPPVLLFPPEPGEEFLRTVLSEWIMDDIRLEAPDNPDVYQQVMNGTYPDGLRKKIYRDLMTDTGRRFEHMIQRCDYLDADINAFLSRANILLELLETEQTPRSPVRDLYIQYQNSNDRCRGLAAFILYALVGHSLFSSIQKKYTH